MCGDVRYQGTGNRTSVYPHFICDVVLIDLLNNESQLWHVHLINLTDNTEEPSQTYSPCINTNDRLLYYHTFYCNFGCRCRHHFADRISCFLVSAGHPMCFTGLISEIQNLCRLNRNELQLLCLQDVTSWCCDVAYREMGVYKHQ